jgi:hypothetical protein
LGTISGQKVFTQPICENRMYCGTITTWNGSMMVSNMMPNSSFLAVNCSRAKAYAAIEQEIRLPRIDPITTIAELIM